MITFKAIKPAKFDSEAFQRAFIKAAERIVPKIHADLKRPTMTWVPPVEFEERVFLGSRAAVEAGGTLAARDGAGVAIQVTTDDKRFLFVDEGTKVRYATMTPDFIAKTKPKSLKAGKGRGGLLFVNKKKPRPGIKARGFTKLVAKKWNPLFRAAMSEAMAAGAKKSGHGAK